MKYLLSIDSSLLAHTNWKGYFVPKNWFPILILKIFDLYIQIINKFSPLHTITYYSHRFVENNRPCFQNCATALIYANWKCRLRLPQLSLTGNSLKKMSKMSGNFFWVKWHVLSYPYQLQNKNASPFWENCVFVILSILKND